ncbi:MAG: transcriptional regulator [Rhodobacteraceae bacterium PARR1]|nr:MAG: transcriptional regulator [Rhodobacteraceae bacterium PARR1]
MTQLNIMFSAAGRRVSLLRHFRRSLDAMGIEGQVIAADAGKTAPAAFVADHIVQVPRVSAPNYIDSMVEACRAHRVGLLFPLIDTDLVLLSENRARFEAVGTRVVVSAPDTVRLSFDKRLTAEFFVAHGIDTPTVYAEAQWSGLGDEHLPLIVKPWDGSCSIGVTRVTSTPDLHHATSTVNHPMVQECVSGQEFTIDVLAGFDGQVKCVVPRLRIETRAGEVSKGLTVKDPALMSAARQLVNCLPGAVGCITVQCFRQADGRVRFIEINPRFGGGFPLSLHAGADFPRWIIQEHLGQPAEARMDAWTDDLAMLRYDDEIIVRGEQIR